MSRNHSILNREIILKTALAILDESGLDALSMRTLAKQLNVKAMSLYNHIKNKEDLLNGIVEIILNEIEFSENTSDWKTNLRSIACSFYDALLRHPNVLPIISTHSPVSVRGLEQTEKFLSVLKDANITELSAFSLMHIIVAYIIGHASMSLTDRQGVDDYNEQQPLYGQIDLRIFPNVLEASRILSQRNVNEEFVYGLNLLLDHL